MRETLNTAGAGSRAQVLEVLQPYETLLTTQTGEQGQLAEAEAAAESLLRKIDEIIAQFIADQTQKLVEAERKRDQTEQDLAKARAKNDRTRLLAPIVGTVQQLAVTTPGQVVLGGQSIMTIVPDANPIEIEVMIQNKDIGFIEPGQAAVIKVDAFPYARYGSVDGTVMRVSHDSVDIKEGTGAGEPAYLKKSGSMNPTEDLVFPATILLAQPSIIADGKTISLSPGMSVTAEIKTGRRRAIDYALSPLREATSQVAHER